jgi:hypothetical protein
VTALAVAGHVIDETALLGMMISELDPNPTATSW